MADDKFVFAFLLLSISLIIAATDMPRAVAMRFNTSMNSGSRVILVWCPDKDTDIFFIKISQRLNSLSLRDMGRYICVMGVMLSCPTYSMCQMYQMQTRISRYDQK